MDKEAKNLSYALSIILYDNQHNPEKIIEICKRGFSNALDFTYEHSRFDRSKERDNFKKTLLKLLSKEINKYMKKI